MSYATWLFDCDGVLLDSNKVKSDAFHEVARRFDPSVAREFVSYHMANGGVSRFDKFDYLFREMLGRDRYEREMDEALAQFASLCRDGLAAAPEAAGLRDMMAALRAEGAKTIVVSGGEQAELRAVFRCRGLDRYFDAIFGSPVKKHDIVRRELAAGLVSLPAVLVGDSRLDYEAAADNGLDFVFLSGWTEFADWRNYFADKDVTVMTSLQDLL